MKKQLFKALAATAIVGAVMAMSSVVASAATTTYKLEDKIPATSFASNAKVTLEEGSLEANFNERHEEKDKNFNGVDYGYSFKLNTISEKDSAKIDSKNLIAYTGKKGDKLTLLTKGNNVKYVVRYKEGTAITDHIGTVTDKADLEESSYTLNDDGTVYIYAPKESLPEGGSSQSVYVFQITVETAETSGGTTEEIGTELEVLENGAVIAVSNDTYIIAAVAKDSDIMDQESITIGVPGATFAPEQPTTSKVYDTIHINGEDLSLDPNNYYYAIKVTNSKDIRLKNFTVQ